MADFVDVNVGAVDLDLEGEDPGAEDFDGVEYLEAVLLVGEAVFQDFLDVLLQIGDFVAEPMVLEFHRIGHLLVLLAARLPVLLLADVGSGDEHAVLVFAARFDGLLDDLGVTWGTVSLTRSDSPVSSG